jgi:hypothetical protein
MATLKCLACGHDNNVGDEWCSSCSSSLNLRLCSACEAINASDAERCHSCNAEFRIEPEVVTFEMDAPPQVEPVAAAAPPGQALPAVWRLAADHARKRSSRSAAVLAVLPLLAAGAAYYFYAGSQAAPLAPQLAPKVEAAQKSEPAPDPEAAPKEPARPQTAEVKPAQPPAVSGKITAPRTAAAPARTTPLSQPKRMGAAVTHTRAAGAEAPSRAAAADAPAEPAVATLPVPTTLPVSATSASAANARILPVSESPTAIADPRRMSITHTKADLTESAVTTAAPVAAAQVRTVPAEARNDEPTGCPPAVVALGLCKSR